MTNAPVYAQAATPLELAPAFPTVATEHTHARALLTNAMRYLATESGTTDAISGYPVEGWNDDPHKGLCLRCFTQLTAIGEWMEVLANIIAGHADTDYLSREEALSRLTLVIGSLRHDQQDPQLSTKGLLGNFLDLASGKRLSPLASQVDKLAFLSAFGPEKGEAIWQALKVKGWIVAGRSNRDADIQRSANYGALFFDGPLAPYADQPTQQQIMAILDQRVVNVMFGDNANLTASVGKTIGTLLLPEIVDNPPVAQLRRDMEQFLEDQQEGYHYLYDAQAGLFSFGWDAARNRFLGWEDAEGNWRKGHMDYLVNEFRGPTKFVVLRYGLPLAAVKNLAFKIKPYRLASGSDAYVLAPWEGSAFQALGLGLCMMELHNPSWQEVLSNVVDVEIDYATRNRLPGFLSESYTGQGTQYTGDVGISEIAVTTMPRITCAASLYTLGVAYMIAPAKIEQFLAANWPVMSTLLTDHGPWEGFNVAQGEPIRVQTSAHTLSLILGLLGTGPESMKRYLDAKSLHAGLSEIYKPGREVDFLSDGTQVFAWGNKDAAVESAREPGAFHIKGDRVGQLGVAFVPPQQAGVNLSSGVLSIRYRSAQPLECAAICFKPVGNADIAAPSIANELFTHFADTGGQDANIHVPLPATPGLTGIKEVVLTACHNDTPLDLVLTDFRFTPVQPSPTAPAAAPAAGSSAAAPAEKETPAER
jgi:hypothetical protein